MKNATKTFASTLGAIMALAGIEHGIGEVLQGNIKPEGIMILSWPDSAFFRSLGGEPAMTIVPNLFITGFLAIFVSVLLFVWAVFFVHRKNGGLVMMLLSLGMLLLGGGIFPPVFGIITGAVATKIHSRHTWWRSQLSLPLRQALRSLWPFVLATCGAAWFLVFPIAYLSGMDNPYPILTILLIALFSFVLAILSSFAVDSQKGVSS